MHRFLLLNVCVLLGITACELKVSPGDTDDMDESTGSATSGESDSAGTTTGGSEATTGQSTNGATTTAGTATATSTTTDATTGMTATSTTSATSLTDPTTETTSDPPQPMEPQPCEGDATPIEAQTIAYLQSQIPPNGDTTGGGSSSTTGGGRLDPATLHVRLSSQTFTCADPNANLVCGPNWEVSFAIPPEAQKPGLYHLSGPEIFGYGGETGAPDGNGECSFGGGSFWATLEIVEIDNEQITGRLCHIQGISPEPAPNLEGSFSASRCQ